MTLLRARDVRRAGGSSTASSTGTGSAGAPRRGAVRLRRARPADHGALFPETTAPSFWARPRGGGRGSIVVWERGLELNGINGRTTRLRLEPMLEPMRDPTVGSVLIRRGISVAVGPVRGSCAFPSLSWAR
jgi:hypothetical protein